MKQISLFLVVGLMALAVTSCEDTKRYVKTVDFEDVELGEEGYYNGSDKSGEELDGSYLTYIRSSIAELVNFYAESEWGGYWKGFSISSHTDTLTPGYFNQYSSIVGAGANSSEKYAVAYASTGDSAVIYLQRTANTEAIETVYPRSLMITNSTYTYLTIKDGDMFSTRFGEGDWFKVTIAGYRDAEKTGLLDFYLADFREGKTEIIDKWIKVDLSALGRADRLVFSFDSTDKTAGWINTPAYACIDNLVVEFEEQ
jgi:hypothetical protein